MTTFNFKMVGDIRNKKFFKKLGRMTEDTRRGLRQAHNKNGRKIITDIAIDILRTPRHGRKYWIRGRMHTASVPFEAPAELSGALRKSLDFNVKGYSKVVVGYDNTVDYGGWLEEGTVDGEGEGNLLPRPALLIGVTKNEVNGTIEKNFRSELKKAFKSKGA